MSPSMMSPSKDAIIIPPNLEHDLTGLLTHLCLNVQKEFDISPLLLNQLINDPLWLEKCHFLQSQCYQEMLNHLTIFKEQYQSCLEHSETLQFNPNEYEKCGHLIHIYKNGYMKYCNLHKYLHPHPDMSVKTCYGPEVEHVFVVKNNQQIIKEKYNCSIHNIYINYLHKLYNLCKHLYDDTIIHSCDIIRLDTTTAIDTFVQQMQTDSTLFKSKRLYQQIQLDASESPTTSYYVKGYHYLLRSTDLQDNK